MNRLRPGRYRHYKGGEYEVLATAIDSETREEVVVYRALYGEYGLWVRPLSMFTQSVEIGDVQTPRFAFIGAADQRRLAPDSLSAARDFIFAHGRPLEQALYRWHFEDGDAADVLEALAAFRNADGGFGHALEPDLRTTESSILATTTAFQILRALGVAYSHPFVKEGIAYFVATFDPEEMRWPFIPPSTNDAPHAPWWTAGPDHAGWFGGYLINPRAEIVGLLYRYQDLVDDRWLDSIARSLQEHMEVRETPLDMNEILSAHRLLLTPSAPESLRKSALDAIGRSLPANLATTIEQWESYGLQPLALAPEPASPFAAQLSALLPANLDFRVEEQEADGSWTPSWSWGDLDPEHWQLARREWQGVLTLEALRQLSAWGRLAL